MESFYMVSKQRRANASAAVDGSHSNLGMPRICRSRDLEYRSLSVKIELFFVINSLIQSDFRVNDLM
jgi:hypothetical protein